MEREWRLLLGTGLALLGLYGVLFGLLWLARVGDVVRLPFLVRTPLDLLISLPAVALYLTVVLVGVARGLVRERTGLRPLLSQPLERSPARLSLLRVPPLTPTASHEEAVRRAVAYRVPLLPCVEGGTLVGAVALEDLLARSDGRLPVGSAPTVRVDEPLARLLERLGEAPAVLVVDRDGSTYLGLLDARSLLLAVWRVTGG